jgi:hypothetical protein
MTDETETPRTAAGRALLDELAESPLPGARYAHEVVRRRLAAIEEESYDEPAKATDAAMNYGQGYAAALREVEGTVDAAWAEAEAALPEGWYMGVQYGNRDAAYVAIAADMFWLTDSLTGTFADGSTPAEALRALAAQLRSRTAAHPEEAPRV